MAGLEGLTGVEHQHQVTVATWALLHERKYPELALLYAIPNGGQRHAAVASKLKAEGVKPGVLDLNLPVARGGFLGLWIEMKAGTNTTTDHQDRWINGLAGQGHLVALCWTADWAIEILADYTKGKLCKTGLTGVTALSSSSRAGRAFLISNASWSRNAAKRTPAASS